MDIIWQPMRFNDQPKVEGQKEKIDGTNLEETLFADGGKFCVGEPPHTGIISPPLRIELDINVFFNTKDLESLKMLFDLPENAEVDMSKVAKRSDGKITDFYVDGKRYAVRYDESGKIEKTLVMEFDENGNLTNQKIKNYNEEGKLENTVDYEYTKDGNQISQTRTARSAEYGEPSTVMQRFFGTLYYTLPDDVKYDQEGRITDIYIAGERYSLRYGENGEVEKTIRQTFHENGNVATQNIHTMLNTGWLGKDMAIDSYSYDENGNQSSHEQMFVVAKKYFERLSMID